MKEETLEEKVKESNFTLKGYLVDTSGLLFMTMPLGASFDTLLYGLDLDESARARTNIAITAYAGTAYAYSKTRDGLHHIFDIDNETKGLKRSTVDFAHSLGFNVPFAALMYYLAGAEQEEIISAAIGAAPLAMVFAPFNAFAIDLSRHLMGTHESEKVPIIFQEASDEANKKAFYGICAGGILATGLVYGIDSQIGKFIDPYRETIVNYVSHLF